MTDVTEGLPGSHSQTRRHQMVKDEKRVSSRLSGLDLARFFAFVGMVIVNFAVVTNGGGDVGIAGKVLGALEGRAAATFVVLAGIGMGLAGANHSFATTLKRVGFLAVIGLLNMLIFPADIIHYYAAYFLFGSLLLQASTRLISASIVFLVLGFVLLLLVLDYDAGWNWETLSYSGFWSLTGFTRNLFFNGWHPVVPWLAFFLFGILLARLPLSKAPIQGWMMVAGLATVLAAEWFSHFLMSAAPVIDGESVAPIFATKPVPPGPLYMLAGMGSTLFAVGACLRLGAMLEGTVLLKLLCAPGRQTLTLYFAHIFIGMGILQAMGLLADQHHKFVSSNTVLSAALLFSAAALLYAVVWERFFTRGPLEAVLRRLG